MPGKSLRLIQQSALTSKTKLLNFVADLTEKVKLEEADIIVSGGRGLAKPENFQLIRDFAAALGAAVGSSRPCVDEGWIPYSHQVGQTGKTSVPTLHCGGHLRRGPAHGRYADLRLYRRH